MLDMHLSSTFGLFYPQRLYWPENQIEDFQLQNTIITIVDDYEGLLPKAECKSDIDLIKTAGGSMYAKDLFAVQQLKKYCATVAVSVAGLMLLLKRDNPAFTDEQGLGTACHFFQKTFGNCKIDESKENHRNRYCSIYIPVAPQKAFLISLDGSCSPNTNVFFASCESNEPDESNEPVVGQLQAKKSCIIS